MGGKKHFFIMDIIILIVFLGLIRFIFSLNKIPFLTEVFLTTIALLIAFIALIGFYNKSKWSAVLLYLVFMFTTINLLIFRYYGRKSNWLLILSTLGLLISLAYIKDPEDNYLDFDPEPIKPETDFSPGKYVASKTGATYHSPKCEWAEKIKEKNRVWFDDEKEAKKKYKAHSCIKDPVYTNF